LPVTIKVKEPPAHELIYKVGSIQLEYGVRGEELARELLKATTDFVRAMELRGLTLYRTLGQANPYWITDVDGEKAKWYAIDWTGDRGERKEVRSGELHRDLPKLRETSLDDSWGFVEYRCVGIFWSPQASVEILRSIHDIHEEEKTAKHPTQFGYGKQPKTGDRTGNRTRDRREQTSGNS